MSIPLLLALLILLVILLILMTGWGLFAHRQATRFKQKNRSLQSELNRVLEQTVVLQENAERFQNTFEQAAIGIAHVAPDGTWLRVNQKLCEIVGYSRKELLQLTFQAITVPEDLDLDLTNVQKILAGEISTYSMEKRYIRKDQSLVWIDLTVSLVRDQAGQPKYFVSVVEDISDRRQKRDLLHTRDQQQEAVTQLSQQALSDRNLDTLFGRATQLVSEKLDVEYSKVLECLPDGKELFLRAGVGWHSGLVGQAVVSASLQSQAGYTLSAKVPVLVEDLKTETRFRGPQLLTEHNVISGISVIISTGERPFGVLGAHTQQKKAFSQDDINFIQSIANVLGMAIERQQTETEVRLLNDTLEERVRDRTLQLEELNQELKSFTFTVSHDLRAPLRALQGFATALLEDYTDDLDALGLEYARRLITSAQQMEQLIQGLLSYSRLSQKNIQFQDISLKAMIAQALADHDPEISKRQAQIAIAPDLPSVFGNQTILQQVISNLIDNALKFVPPTTQPILSIWAEQQENRVRLWLEDNGLGIAPDHQERIFKVFERLHSIETYPGTGIGLAIVRKGMAQMDGDVGVESTLGQGSRFWIEVPTKSP